MVWGLEKFHYFIYGNHYTLHTDHKPLESIFKKKLTHCPPRLQRLLIYEGWPNSRSECPLPLCDFWNFREDLTIEDGIILKCDRIVVPPTLRPNILKTVHQGHLGVEKCLLRARSSVLARNHK